MAPMQMQKESPSWQAPSLPGRAPVPELDRLRFNWEQTGNQVHSYDTIAIYGLVDCPAGDALSSRLKGSQLHAPVLDADCPVTVHDCNTVTFSTWSRRTKVIAMLRAMLAAGFITDENHALLRELEAAPRHKVWTRRTTLVFSYEVVALPSRSRGHHHLLMQSAMSWPRAQELAALLGGAGLTDARHANISSRGDCLFVMQPL